MDLALAFIVWIANLFVLYFIIKTAVEQAGTTELLIQIRNDLADIKKELRSQKES